MDIVRQSLRHARNPAIVSQQNVRRNETSNYPTHALVRRRQVLKHRDVITAALHLRHALLDDPRTPSNVAITTDALSSFVSALFGTWMAGAVAVPVPPSHPDAAIEYILRDSRPEVVLCDEAHVERMRALHPRVVCMPPRGGFRFLSTPHLLGGAIDALGRSEQRWRDEDHALILYTSGTTGRYVGIVEYRGWVVFPPHPTRASNRTIVGLDDTGWVPWDHLYHLDHHINERSSRGGGGGGVDSYPSLSLPISPSRFLSRTGLKVSSIRMVRNLLTD